MIPALTNHVWQSTLFAAIAGLLTLALRKNRAQSRHWVWLAASMKFLLPFSLLVALGGHFSWRTAPAIATPPPLVVVEEISQPFADPIAAPVPPAANVSFDRTRLIGIVWACGILAVLFHWLLRWLRVRVVLRSSLPIDLLFPVRVRTSTSLIEPGVFGIFRPVLLLPEGIQERLAPEQLRAILTHELTHIRRRDNLTAFLHMLVEAVFWFHPLVWWIGTRLVEERERACDEEVLRRGSDPQVYAEGILNICKLYVESPLACVSGVTGSNLKKRIESIMDHRTVLRLTFAKKAILGFAAAAALTAPVVVGIMNSPLHAQDAQSAADGPKFEVASVKPSAPGGPRFPIDSGDVMVHTLGHAPFPAHGRIDIRAWPLKWVIMTAYDVKDLQVLGGPAWATSDRYDIVAKAEDGNATFDQMRPMLRSLLAERFKLTLRHETRDLPIYELTAAKGGIKIEEAKEGSCGQFDPDAPRPVLDGKHPAPRPNICGGWWRMVVRGAPDRRDRIEALSITMPRLIEIISQDVNDRIILDKTGFTPKFDMRLDFAPTPGSSGGGWMPVPPAEAGASASLPGASIFSALQEQLGLRLAPAKGPVDVLVVDRAERPSDNQTPPITPKFEVASVKPSTGCEDTDGGRSGGRGGGAGNAVGRVDLRCLTVMDLVRIAYIRFANGHRNPPASVPISGGPAWVNSDRFDIDAKAEGPQPMETMRGPMLQTLLEDRFRLKVRRETRDIPIYALTVAKGGAKFQPSKKGSCVVLEPGQMPPAEEPGQPPIHLCGVYQPGANGGMQTYGQTMEDLCRQFMVKLDRPCVDRTGLAGTFDIHLDLSFDDLFPAGPPRDGQTPPDAAAPADPLGPIFAAVQKLGLKLEASKGPGAFLVIEHVEKPSAN